MVCAQPDGSMSSLLQSTGSSPYVLPYVLVGPLAATTAAKDEAQSHSTILAFLKSNLYDEF